MAYLTNSAVIRGSLTARLRNLAAFLLARRRVYRDRAAILHNLRRLEDRDLRDLQLHCYDFKAIAKGRWRR
jgi:hypothetical protein